MFRVVFSSIDNFLRFVTQLCLLATIQCLPNVDFMALSWINSEPQTSLWKPAGVFIRFSNTACGPVVLGPRNMQRNDSLWQTYNSKWSDEHFNPIRTIFENYILLVFEKCLVIFLPSM